MMRGQAFRYTGWMLVDRHVPRLAGSLAMSAAFMLPLWIATHRGEPLWTWTLLERAALTILRGRWPKDQSTLGDVLHAVLPPYHLMGNEPVVTTGGWAGSSPGRSAFSS